MSRVAISDVLRGIQVKPLEPELWASLREAAQQKGDEKAVETLNVVHAGLVKAAENGGDGSHLTGLQRSAFVRLSKSCNNPSLLKEIGIIHLNEFKLPEIAREHFVQAKALGSFDPDLGILLNQVEEAEARAGEPMELEESVDKARHARPKAAELIRKTGKLAMTAKKLSGFEVSEAKPALDDTGTIAPSYVPKDFEEAVTLAVGEADAGRRRKAMAVAEIFTRRENDAELTSSMWSNLGEVLFKQGCFEQAQQAYRVAKDLDPQDMRNWFNLGLSQHLQGDYEAALQSYTMADQSEPDHPKVWCNIGVLHFQNDQHQAAERALDKAVESKPDYGRAWDNLAAALGAQDKLKEAAEACSRAIEIRGDFPEPWLKLGIICFHNEQYAEAKEAFENAEGLTETSAYALHYLAMVQAKLGDPDQALSHVLQATGIDPECDLGWMGWNETGLSYAAKEQYDKAIVAYERALLLQPGAVEVLFNEGIARSKAGDLEKAAEALSRLVQIDPMIFEAWHHLGSILLSLKRYEEAIECFEQQVELRPRRREAWESLAGAYEAVGMVERAEAAERQARKVALHEQVA